MRKDQYRLEDNLEPVDNITRRTVVGKESFLEDELLRTWVIHHLQTIGEAARDLSEPLRAKRPDVPWSQIIAFRNNVVHEYFGVDYEEMWWIVESELAPLRVSIAELLAGEVEPQ